MTLAMDSNPNSELNQSRKRLHDAKRAFGGHMDRAARIAATREMNWSRTALRKVAYRERGKRYAPLCYESAHIETTVCGVPCGVVVDWYTPGRPWRQHNFPGAGPGDCDPPEPAECEWHLVDRKGYDALWLEEKMDEVDRDRITAMVI